MASAWSADVGQHGPEVLEVEEEQAVLVGHPEDHLEHAGLGLVEGQHPGEEERAHLRDGGPQRVALAAEDVEEGDRAGLRLEASRPSCLARSRTFWLSPPALAMPERSPFTSARKTGTPMRLKPSASMRRVTVLPVPVAPATRPWRLARAGRSARGPAPLATTIGSTGMARMVAQGRPGSTWEHTADAAGPSRPVGTYGRAVRCRWQWREGHRMRIVASSLDLASSATVVRATTRQASLQAWVGAPPAAGDRRGAAGGGSSAAVRRRRRRPGLRVADRRLDGARRRRRRDRRGARRPLADGADAPGPARPRHPPQDLPARGRPHQVRPRDPGCLRRPGPAGGGRRPGQRPALQPGARRRGHTGPPGLGAALRRGGDHRRHRDHPLRGPRAR